MGDGGCRGCVVRGGGWVGRMTSGKRTGSARGMPLTWSGALCHQPLRHNPSTPSASYHMQTNKWHVGAKCKRPHGSLRKGLPG
eukprot:2646769-Prorocentrum_lima.AAC.1